MNLKQELVAALKSNATHLSLLQLVRGHQAKGLTPQESYDVLEQIWQEFGFAVSEAKNATRDNLEYVMERVWFQGAN